jgi:hypothetical protein
MDGEFEFLAVDHVGSVSLAPDANENLIAHALYAPYGKLR